MLKRVLASLAILGCGIASAAYAQSDAGASGTGQSAPQSPTTRTVDRNAAQPSTDNANDRQESAGREVGKSDADRNSATDKKDGDSSAANRDRDDSDAGENRPRPSDEARSENRDDDNDRRQRDRRNSSWNRDRNDDRDTRDDRNNYSRRNDDNDRNDDWNHDNRNADRRDRDDRDRDGNRRFSFDRDNRDDRDGDNRHGIEFSTSRNGLIIADLAASSVAGRIGLRNGDRIVSVNGYRVNDADNFDRYLIGRGGQRVPIVVWRNGQEQTIYWTDSQQYGQGRETFAQDRWHDGEYSDNDDDRQRQSGAFLGVDFDTRYRDAVVVRRVHPNSPAQRSGVRAGDTILSINGESVSSGDDVSELVSQMSPGDEIDLQVAQAPPRTLQVRLGTRQPQQGYAGYRGEIQDNENLGYDSDDDDREWNDNDRGLFDNERAAIDRVRNRAGGLFGRD